MPKHGSCDTILLASRRYHLDRRGHLAASGPKPFRRATRPRSPPTAANSTPVIRFAGPRSNVASIPKLQLTGLSTATAIRLATPGPKPVRLRCFPLSLRRMTIRSIRVPRPRRSATSFRVCSGSPVQHLGRCSLAGSRTEVRLPAGLLRPLLQVTNCRLASRPATPKCDGSCQRAAARRSRALDLRILPAADAEAPAACRMVGRSSR